eukprot:UN22624
MSPRRFGCELEMFIPNSDLDRADVVRNLQSRGVNVELGSHDSSRNNYENGKFKIVHDGSVNNGSANGGGATHCAFELVSPVMQNNSGVDKLYECVKHLGELGAKVDRSAGYHVHANMKNTTLDAKKKVAWNWHKYEEAFDLLVSESRRGTNKYCRSNRKHYSSYDSESLKNYIKNIRSLEDLIKFMNPPLNDTSTSPCRYYKLNFTCLRSNSHNTIEFRLHQGTHNTIKARNWVALCLKFVDASIEEGYTPCFKSNRTAEYKLK